MLPNLLSSFNNSFIPLELGRKSKSTFISFNFSFLSLISFISLILFSIFKQSLINEIKKNEIVSPLGKENQKFWGHYFIIYNIYYNYILKIKSLLLNKILTYILFKLKLRDYYFIGQLSLYFW